MDFAWLLYIGMNKLGFTEKQVGRMTFKKWSLLYKSYKMNFDYELYMNKTGETYSNMEKEPDIDDVIPL